MISLVSYHLRIHILLPTMTAISSDGHCFSHCGHDSLDNPGYLAYLSLPCGAYYGCRWNTLSLYWYIWLVSLSCRHKRCSLSSYFVAVIILVVLTLIFIIYVLRTLAILSRWSWSAWTDVLMSKMAPPCRIYTPSHGCVYTAARIIISMVQDN